MARPRVLATLPDDVYELLVDWAEQEQIQLSKLVSYVLTNVVKRIREGQQNKQAFQSHLQKNFFKVDCASGIEIDRLVALANGKADLTIGEIAKIQEVLGLSEEQAVKRHEALLRLRQKQTPHPERAKGNK